MSSSSVRRRRRSRAVWIWAIVVLAGLVGAYMIWSPSKSEQNQEPVAEANESERLTPPPPEPPTITINQTRQPAPAVAAVNDPAPAPVAPAAPVQPQPRPSPPPATTARSDSSTVAAIQQGMKLIEQGKLVEGRSALSAVLTSGQPLTPADAQVIRDTLGSINQKLVFSKEITPGDPLVEDYVVQSGDVLARIAPRYNVTAGFLERVNQVDPRRIFVGQHLKIIKGPFHAVVTKSEYRMDIYLADDQGKATYVRSFVVGLGENDSTPIGTFMVRQGGKVVNPAWTNPRTGESFGRDDPKNPIGEYWIALDGMDENTRGLRGYGVHGTIEPESIGRQASMGCVRMADADIELVFHMLMDGKSTVTIRR